MTLPNPQFRTVLKILQMFLNTHFTSVAKTLANGLPKTDSKYSDYLGSENKFTMYLKYIELFEILDEIKKICVTKAMGFDEIAPQSC